MTKPTNRWSRSPDAHHHRSRETDRRNNRPDIRDQRAEGRYTRGDKRNSVSDFLDRFRHRRQESGWEDRPVHHHHHHHHYPKLDGSYQQPQRPIEQYVGYTGPYSGNGQLDNSLPNGGYGQYPVGDPGYSVPQNGGYGQYPVGDPGYSVPQNGGYGQYPNVGDPGFSQPTYGPQLPPGGYPNNTTPVYGPQLPNAVDAQPQGPAGSADIIDGLRSRLHPNDGMEAKRMLGMLRQMEQQQPGAVSAEARSCINILEKYVKASGPNGISGPDLQKMYAEMGGVKDASMYHSLQRLEGQAQPITGEQMGRAILRGASDKDSNGNGTELQQLKDWANANAARLSPAAKMAIKAYVDIAEASKARGAPGLTAVDMGQLRKQLKGAALADQLE